MKKFWIVGFGLILFILTAYADTGSTIQIGSPRAWSNTSSKLVRFNVTDNLMINSSSIVVGGTTNFSLSYCTVTNTLIRCSFLGNFSTGPSQLMVSARDNASNVVSTQAYFTFDNLGPRIAATIYPVSDINNRASSFTLNYSALENVSRVEAHKSQVGLGAKNISVEGDYLSIFEKLSSVISEFDETQIGSLKPGNISNTFGKFAYEQYLDNAKNASIIHTINTNHSTEPEFYLKFVDTYEIFVYKLWFYPNAIKSRIDDESHMIDLHGKTVNILGRDFVISHTNNTNGRISFITGDSLNRLSQGERRTYLVGGDTYNVYASIIQDNTVLFNVNSEVVDALGVGDCYILADYSRICVTNATNRSTTNTVDFFLKGQTLTVEDDDYTQNTYGQVYIDEQEVAGLEGDIYATVNATQIDLEKIKIRWRADKDYYVPIDSNLSSQLNSSTRDDLLLNNVDYEVHENNYGQTEYIYIRSGATDRYKIQMETKTGSMDFTAVYSNGSSSCNLGRDDNRRIVTFPNTNISTDWSFIVSNNKFSHLIKVVSFDSGNQKVQFQDNGTGALFEVSTTGNEGIIYLDGYAHNFRAYYTSAKMKITDPTMGLDGAVLYTLNGTGLRLKDLGNDCLINITEKETANEPGIKHSLNIVMHDDGPVSDLNIQSVTSTDNYFRLANSSNGNISTGYTSYGTKVWYNLDYDQDTVNLTIPYYEARADVEIVSNSEERRYTGYTDVSQAWYTVNGSATKHQLNISRQSEQISGLSGGPYTIRVYANDTSGNIQNITAGTLYFNEFFNSTNLTESMTQGDVASVVLYLPDGSQATGNVLLNQTIREVIRANTTIAQTNITINFTVYGTSINSANADKPILNVNKTSPIALMISSKIGGTTIDSFAFYQNMSYMISNYTNSTGHAQWVQIVISKNLGTKAVLYISDDAGKNITVLERCLGNTKPTTTPSVANSCYTNRTNRITVYVPHLSGVGLADPSYAPSYTVTAPGSSITDSKLSFNGMIYDLNLNTSSCVYNLTKGPTVVTGSSVTPTLAQGNTNYSFSASYTSLSVFRNLTNGSRYNATISCASVDGNRSRARTQFLVVDRTKATTTVGVSKTSTTASITVTSTYEAINYTLRYWGGSIGVTKTGSNGFSTTQSASLSSLTASTTYYYNYTYCDRAKNCNTTLTTSFATDAAAATPSSGGGGGGGGGLSSKKLTTTSKYWDILRQGQNSMQIATDDYGIRKMTFSVMDNTMKAMIEVQRYTDKPGEVSDASNKVYKYLKISLTNLKQEDLNGSVTVEFTVSQEWLKNKSVQASDITLKRYADGAWVDLETKQKGTTTKEITYEATTPGFSYFAIADKKAVAPTATTPEATPVVKPAETAKTETNGNQEAPTQETQQDKKTESKSKTLWYTISIIAVITLVAAILFFKRKKTNPVKQAALQQPSEETGHHP